MRGADSAAAAAIIFVVSFVVVRSFVPNPFFRTKQRNRRSFVRRPSPPPRPPPPRPACKQLVKKLARRAGRRLRRRRRRRITFFGTFVFMRTGGRERRLTAAARPARPPRPAAQREGEEDDGDDEAAKRVGEERERECGPRGEGIQGSANYLRKEVAQDQWMTGNPTQSLTSFKALDGKTRVNMCMSLEEEDIQGFF